MAGHSKDRLEACIPLSKERCSMRTEGLYCEGDSSSGTYPRALKSVARLEQHVTSEYR